MGSNLNRLRDTGAALRHAVLIGAVERFGRVVMTA
jgi:Cu/Ag efflux pump CusA